MIRIHDFVPPIIQKVRNRLKRRTSESEDVRTKTFSDYGTAAAVCSGGWNDDALAEKIVADAKVARDRAIVTPLELRAAQAVGWALAEREAGSGPLRVLEFGGSAGFNYFPIRTFFPSVEIQWAIVETPSMVRAAGRELASSGLGFFTTLEQAIETIGMPDLSFSCGVLQYLPDPLGAVGNLTAAKAPRLVLFRTALSDGGTPLYAVQEAMLSHHLVSREEIGDIDRKVRYPVAFVPRTSFREVLRSSYDVVAEVDEGVLNPLPAPTHGYAFFCRRRVVP